MGYYINGSLASKFKSDQLQRKGAIRLDPDEVPTSLGQVPQGLVLICVVENGPFDAAGICYSERELQEFRRVGHTSLDQRHKDFLLMDKYDLIAIDESTKDIIERMEKSIV
jgi:hypothetical protein